MCNPAYRTSQCKDGGEQRHWDPDGFLHNARVEIHVRVELARHEVVVFQGNLFQSHGQLEQRVIFQPHFSQHFLASFLHQLGAGVVVLVHTVTETHQLDARIFVFDLLDEVTDFLNAAVLLNVTEHVQGGLVGTTVCWAPQASYTSCNRCKWVGTRRAAKANRGGRCVLLVVSVQDENAVQCTFQHGVDLVLFARGSEHHVQEIA